VTLGGDVGLDDGVFQEVAEALERGAIALAVEILDELAGVSKLTAQILVN
jgi:hypothetical protein